jgi:hypothetical protein
VRFKEEDGLVVAEGAGNELRAVDAWEDLERTWGGGARAFERAGELGEDEEGI